MKVLLVIVLATVVCYALQRSNEEMCLSKKEGFLRHPHSCHKFIRCSHQRAYEFQCPANLLWHHEIKSCDFPYRTQCKLYEESDKKERVNKNVKKVHESPNEYFGEKVFEDFENKQINKTKKKHAFKLEKNSPQELKISKRKIYEYNNNLKYQAERENVKTADYVTQTVRNVTESVLTGGPLKSIYLLTEGLSVTMYTQAASNENDIKTVTEEIITEFLNFHLEEATTLAYSDTGVQVATSSDKAINEIHTTRNGNYVSKMTERKQDTSSKTTRDINPVNITEMPEEETNSVNLTELQYDLNTFDKKKESFLGTLALRPRFNVTTTESTEELETSNSHNSTDNFNSTAKELEMHLTADSNSDNKQTTSDNLSITDRSTIELYYEENQQIILTAHDSSNSLENLVNLTVATSRESYETTETQYSDMLDSITTMEETIPYSRKKLEVITINHNDKSMSKHLTNNLIQRTSDASQGHTLTKGVTKAPVKSDKDAKPTEIVFDSSEVSKLKTQTYLHTKATVLPTTLSNYYSYDSTTQDPRLPFRSIECQGPNNRKQFKANKCYQYYQCFAGWAFLLNCHEGWRFETKNEQCILDRNKECDSE